MKVVIGNSSGFHFTISGMPQKFLTYDTKNSQSPPLSIFQWTLSSTYSRYPKHSGLAE